MDGPFTPVYSGTKSAVLTETRGDFDLVFQLPVPFEYDSANGNLALKVLIGAVVFDTSTSTNGFAFEAGISPLVARDVGSFQPQFGLVTGFSADGKFPLYGVPEPSVISSLFTLGLVSIGLARMRRKRSR